MTSVNASHILVKTEKEALDILKDLVQKKLTLKTSETLDDNNRAQKEFDEYFASSARKYSLCPSKRQGGNLGNFGPGQMVVEFEQACFNSQNNVGDVVGPVKTQFGFHLIKINSRN
jgi:peptidyl-prolyl cis-trans isomerase C